MEAQTPPFRWAARAGSTFDDYSRGIAVDAAGNSYVTGSFHDVVAFGSTNLTSSGGFDIFVAKYDNAGNVLWAQQAGSSLYDDVGLAIAVDAAGNCYVTGAFSGDATFGTNTLHNIGGTEIFIAKYDTAGNSYVTGYFQSLATFGRTNQVTLFTQIGGDFDIFVAKYDGTGELVWVNQAGGTLDDVGYGIAVDSAGNSFVTGYFNSPTAAFGTNNLNNSNVLSTNSPDIFVAKYNPGGDVVWAKQAGGNDYDRGFGIAVDTAGNSYVSGVFSGSAAFGGITLTNSAGAAPFIARYGSNGSVLWAQKAGGGTDDGSGVVAVDAAGNGYLTGWFSGTATFGNTNLTSRGMDDIFVAKLDSAGHQLWVKQAGGTGFDRGYGVGVDILGNTYVAGFFTNTCTFDTFTLTSNGGWDIFVTRIDGPRLSINRLANQVVIAWPTNAAGLGLQVATNLAPAAIWSNSTNNPVVVGEQNVVTNSISSGTRFYRLKNQ